eukprot:TRINITY_DN67775_c0_g1_i1.p1 TRINITY_DN67775_c0_g1~~TRINITY_DN67775_c0_g1_i1.p1  ORF type:complete len:242 (-),score=28.17 TRINITY_DN67775_c0_g1_i1:217-942(-)
MFRLAFVAAGVHLSAANCDINEFVASHHAKQLCPVEDARGRKIIGRGYDVNTPGARDTFSVLGCDYESIRFGNMCLDDSQVETLFHFELRAAVEQVRNTLRGYDVLCCDLQKVIIELYYSQRASGSADLCDFQTFVSMIDKRLWDAAAEQAAASVWCVQLGEGCAALVQNVRSDCHRNDAGLRNRTRSVHSSDLCCACLLQSGGKQCAQKCNEKSRECEDCINYGGDACTSKCGCTNSLIV